MAARHALQFDVGLTGRDVGRGGAGDGEAGGLAGWAVQDNVAGHIGIRGWGGQRSR